MGLDRPGQPLPVIEEPPSPGAGATVDVDGPGMNGGGMRGATPALPPLRQVIPTFRENPVNVNSPRGRSPVRNRPRDLPVQ